MIFLLKFKFLENCCEKSENGMFLTNYTKNIENAIFWSSSKYYKIAKPAKPANDKTGKWQNRHKFTEIFDILGILRQFSEFSRFLGYPSLKKRYHGGSRHKFAFFKT